MRSGGVFVRVEIVQKTLGGGRNAGEGFARRLYRDNSGQTHTAHSTRAATTTTTVHKLLRAPAFTGD